MTLLQKGGHPPQPGVPHNLKANKNLDEKFLYVAWVHGLTEGDTIHRLALFGYIQTHLYPHYEEPLQGWLKNRTTFWEPSQGGVYRLNRDGYEKMLTLFGKPSHRHPTDFAYRIEAVCGGRRIGVILDPVKRVRACTVDGEAVRNGGIAWRLLVEHGCARDNQYPGRNRASHVWHWILLQRGFVWERYSGS